MRARESERKSSVCVCVCSLLVITIHSNFSPAISLQQKEPREPIYLYEPGAPMFAGDFPPRGRGGGGFPNRGRGRGQVCDSVIFQTVCCSTVQRSVVLGLVVTLFCEKLKIKMLVLRGFP